MREGWTYKKLGEVATIIGGSTPKSNIEEYWGGSHYWVTPADLKGNKYQGATPRTITNLAIQKTNLQLLPIGTVLLSSRAPIGKVAITTVPMYCNQGFKNVVCSEQLLNEFVYWYLLNKTDYLNSLGRGATFKEISKKATEQIPIPVPPLSEQQRIVSELDLLSSIIEKKKAQLKEYDQLAQSIFFDMFGDPVENEKGWKVKKLGELALVKTGPFGSMLHKQDYISNGTPLVNPIHMKDFHIIADMDFTISDEKAEELDKYILQKGDVIFARRGDIGRCAIVTEKENGYLCGTGSLFVRFVVEVVSTFIMYIIRSSSFTNELVSNAKGATMLNLNSSIIEDLRLPLPPLPLQQSFASKIEALERQKALIQQSITEAETLFNSRMDYWFL